MSNYTKRVSRLRVDPEEYGWAMRAPVDTNTSMQKWEHPPTGIQVDYYYTTDMAKVMDKGTKFQEFHVLESKEEARAFWSGVDVLIEDADEDSWDGDEDAEAWEAAATTAGGEDGSSSGDE